MDPMVDSVESLIGILHKCRKAKNVEYAKRVYAHICNNGMEGHRAVGNHIVPLLVDCGSLCDAVQLFNRLLHRTEHSWTSLMSEYARHGDPHQAFNLYGQMHENSVHPSKYTLIALLKACSRLKDRQRGREACLEIVKNGFCTDIFVVTTLVDMYAKCGSLSEAQEAFNKLPFRNVVAWNALIAGYAEHGPGQKALSCYDEMQLDGVSADVVTFICILKACAAIRAKDKGREIHAEIVSRGFARDNFVGNTLVDLYAKCGSVSDAQQVFDSLLVQDVVSWTSLMTGYAEHGPYQEALKCFEQMQMEGVLPNRVTFACALKACGSRRALDKGRELHMEIKQKGFEKDLTVCNTLVDMYAKCGSLLEARIAFDELPSRNIVSWNALIAGYAEHGCGQEALQCYEQMQLEGMSPNEVTYFCALKACGNMGAIETGREMHSMLGQKGFENDPFVGSSLVDMYAKCGSLSEACTAFDSLPVRDVVSWSAMVNGYGMNHEGNMAVRCFEDMKEHGLKPDAATYTCLLNACSHSRLVSKGQVYLKLMKEEHGIVPLVEHYNCVVDLLARSGSLSAAHKFLANMPHYPSIETWTALLSACRTYDQIDLGKICFAQLVLIDPEYAGSYAIMADIYANCGKRGDACRIEELRKLAGAKKKPASALIEVNNKVHEFVVGDNHTKEVAAMLEIMSLKIAEEVHLHDTDLLMMRPLSDKEKKASLCEHAEKVALAFGLLNTSHGQTLHVTKNIRMCNNCHGANKVISRIERREIIVRDGYSVHHFELGVCSCKDVF